MLTWRAQTYTALASDLDLAIIALLVSVFQYIHCLI